MVVVLLAFIALCVAVIAFGNEAVSTAGRSALGLMFPVLIVGGLLMLWALFLVVGLGSIR